jgi:hypothetical protein
MKTIYFLFTKTVGLYVNILSFIALIKLQLAYALFSEPRDGRLAADSLPKTLLQTQQNPHL